MQIRMATGGVFSTNAFLVADETTRQAVLFDAPDNTVGPLLDEAKKQGWDLIGFWMTHGHFDHIADHVAVREAFPSARFLVHAKDEPKLLEPSSMFPLPFILPPLKADAFIEEGQALSVGSLQVQVLYTPGHSPGHVCFHFPNERLLVGGDLIIGGAVGRSDFPDSSPDDLQRSVQRIMKLPGDTRLLPGHGRPSTLEHELQTNEMVRELLETL